MHTIAGDTVTDTDRSAARKKEKGSNGGAWKEREPKLLANGKCKAYLVEDGKPGAAEAAMRRQWAVHPER